MATEQDRVAIGHCPYLGLHADRASFFAEPSEDNYCYATGRPKDVAPDHQTAYCLTAACTTCPRYMPLPAEASPPRQPAASALLDLTPVDALPESAPSGGLRGYFQRASKIELVALTGLIVASLGFIAVYLFVTQPRSVGMGTAQVVTPVRTPARSVVLPGGRAGAEDGFTPTITPERTPTPERGVIANVVFMPTPTLAPGQQMAALSPGGASVGWVSSGERGNRFGDRNLHAGVFDGQQYSSGLQFSLASIPLGSRIDHATLELVGLSGENLSGEGRWAVRLLDPAADANWSSITYERLQTATVADTVGSELRPGDLGPRQVNVFSFSSAQREELERRLANRVISFRIDGPSGETKNLFSWDTGYGGGFGARPVLRIVYQPPPTLTPVVITNTPAPANLATAAAMVVAATQQVQRFGTPTPMPPNVVTAPPPIIIINTPTPGNAATAEWRQIEEQAKILLFGTPTPYPDGVEIYTATPIPPTVPPPPPPTSTPVPPTFTPTPLPLLIPLSTLNIPTGTASPIPTITPAAIPPVLLGKIAFMSDRLGKEAIFVVDPDGGNMALLTNPWAYRQMQEIGRYSPDRVHRLFVRTSQAEVTQKVQGGEVSSSRPNAEIWVQNYPDGWIWNLVAGARITYDPVWSPDGVHIAFVSQESGADEIYVIDRHTRQEKRLTHSTWEWNKHPTWSPDASQIVFWSNRDGRRGLWIMNADGSNQRRLVESEYNDWDPIWIK